MDLSVENRLKVIQYLKETDALKHLPAEVIAKHLDKLIKYEQFEAVEDLHGELIYAWAWWMVTDKALEEYKGGVAEPKRYNRGRNMVGFFGMNNHLSVTSMLRVIRKAMKMFNAKTFSVYTTRGKWLTFNRKERLPRDRKKVKMAKEFIRLIKKDESCHQQQSQLASG